MSLLSAIIISPDGCSTVRRLTRCLAAQTVRHEMELVFVLPPEFLPQLESLVRKASNFILVKESKEAEELIPV